MTLRRTAHVAGILGGAAWLVAYFLSGGAADVLYWGGALLLTFALLDTGMLLVKRGLLALRVFVACALPLLFWMVVAFAVQALSDAALVHAVAGVLVAVGFVVALTRPGPVAPPSPPSAGRRHAAR